MTRWAVLGLCLWPALGAAAVHPPPTRVDVGDGVYLFMTEPYGDVGMDGNSVAVVTSEGVLVFDANGTPAAAAAVLAEIRKLTPQPVRYLVYSHWHWDHWYGAEVYRRAFPDLQIVAHESTRRLMAGPALEFNRPGLEEQLPGYLAYLEKRLAEARAKTPPPADLPALEHLLEEDRAFLEQKKQVHPTLPNLTFTDRLEIHLGGRVIQVLHHEPAVTPGDSFLYLPAEKVLITGDLLVNPVSFALSCYPTGWLHTLERLSGMDARVIVPGHGAPLRDRVLLRATIDVFKELLRQGRLARDRGESVDQAKAAILPTLEPLRRTITGGDPKQDQAFDTMLVDWFLHRVYDEAAGPLGEEIARIPQH